MKVKLLLVGVTALMTGCATNPYLSGEQMINLSPYYEKVKLVCVQHHKLKGNYSGHTNALCTDQAEFMVNDMKATYLKYNEKRLIDKCDVSNTSVINQCLYNEQNNYYLKTISDFVKQFYPLTK